MLVTERNKQLPNFVQVRYTLINQQSDIGELVIFADFMEIECSIANSRVR